MATQVVVRVYVKLDMATQVAVRVNIKLDMATQVVVRVNIKLDMATQVAIRVSIGHRTQRYTVQKGQISRYTIFKNVGIPVYKPFTGNQGLYRV